jgi:hypothetical protein
VLLLCFQLTPNSSCELNWLVQHLLEVYSQESENLEYFGGADLDAAYPVQVGLSIAGQISSLKKVLSQHAVRVFVCSSLPRAVRITEIDFHIRGYREGLVFGHFQPTISRHLARVVLLSK